jgi:pimeloyl-ACP methyl ester carboxylesterase
VVAVLAAGCTGSPSRSSVPRVKLTPCTVGSQLAALCGTVQVPEDWGEPTSRKLSLRVVVVPARAQEHAPDPLVYLEGWGGAATERATWAASTFWRLNETRDLVFVDQRGTGGSRRQTCSGMTPQPGALVQPAVLRAAVERCLASVRPNGDPRHDTTPAAVDDVDRVRAALGYDRINLYGASYGVSSGLAYLQRHGDRVRTAVLDSGSLLDVRLWEQSGLHAQQAFDRLAQRCAADAGCGRAYRPAADLAAVVARLSAKPEKATVSGVPQPVQVDVVAFLSSVVDDYLATPETVVLLPAALHAAARGDWSVMVRQHLKAQGSSRLGEEDVTQLQTLTIRCSDEWAAMDPARITALAPTSPFTRLMLATASWQNALCAVWPHDTGASGTVSTSVPVVFLSGTVDPADPPANVAAARTTMPQSLLVVAPEIGHGVITRDCMTSEATTFVQFGVRPDAARWAACSAMLTLPSFPVG